MSLKDIANGCKGSEGTVSLSPQDASELLALVKESGTAKSLKKASSVTRLLTGKNKDEEAAKKSGEGEPDGSYYPLGNGGIEISCITLNEIVFGSGDDKETSPKEDAGDPLEADDPDDALAASRAVGRTANLNKDQVGITTTIPPGQAVPQSDESESETGVSEVAGDSATEAIDKIGRMISSEKLSHIASTDKRTSVRNAAQKRLSDLG